MTLDTSHEQLWLSCFLPSRRGQLLLVSRQSLLHTRARSLPVTFRSSEAFVAELDTIASHPISNRPYVTRACDCAPQDALHAI